MRSKASHRDELSDVSRGEAEALLGEVSRLQGATRHAWGSPWFALTCFGAVTVVAAAALAALGPAGLVGTWLIGGLAALGLTRRHYRARGRRIGVVGRGALALRWSLSAFVVCFAVALVVGRHAHSRDAGIVASVIVVIAGYLALGWWQRRSDTSVAAAAAGIPALVLAWLSGPPWLVELAFGGALLAAGMSLRARER